MAEFTNTLNKIDVVGVIKDHKLKHGEGTDRETQAKYNYVNGQVTIKCGETREIDIKVYAKQFNKNGTENKKYNNLMSVINGEYLTMAQVSEEEAHKVSVWGNGNFTPQLKDNFYAKDGKVSETIDLDLGMGNFTVKEPHTVTPEDYKAEFEVNVFVYEVAEEVNREEQPTGRAKVTSFVPLYGGKVLPLTMYAGKVLESDGSEYDFGADVLNGVSAGDTVAFWGEICFEKSTISVAKEGNAIGGRQKTETKTIRVKEFVVTGGSIIDDYEKAFEQDDIQEAVKQRNIAKDEALKNEGTNNKKEEKGRGGIGAKPTSPVAPTSPAQKARPLF